jgi:integrase
MRAMRGMYERIRGSGVWWIRYADSLGKIRRERVTWKKLADAGIRVPSRTRLAQPGKDLAESLYRDRVSKRDRGEGSPAVLRQRIVHISELCDDAVAYTKANNLGFKWDGYRIGVLKRKFGDLPADLPIENFREWFSAQNWGPATFNRYKAMLSLIYRLAIEHGKARLNPARLLKRKREEVGRIRFLGQCSPLPTEIDFLRDITDEEGRLRAVIQRHYPFHQPEFDVALHTGMRPSEQYGLKWDRVDMTRRSVTILRSKNGRPRHIPLNSVALTACKVLYNQPGRTDWVFVGTGGRKLSGYKHWFDPAVRTAGITNFSWYCLRHTFASRLVMAGVDIRTVADLMGHQTIQMTMRYAHLAPAHRLAAVERLVEVSTDTKTDTGWKVETDSRQQVVPLQ